VNILQKRYNFGEDFTLSYVSIDDKPFTGCPYILEDAVREIPNIPVEKWKIPCETAIPVGTYEVKKTWSNRWSCLMWELTGIKSFAGVRPHAGNTSHDTEGCPICGKERDEKHGEVSGSRVARDALYAKMEQASARGEKIFWTVEGIKP
jgi:hypothetical protein